MGGYPESYPTVNGYQDWSEFAIRNRHGTAQDFLYVQEYCEKVRDVMIPA